MSKMQSSPHLHPSVDGKSVYEKRRRNKTIRIDGIVDLWWSMLLRGKGGVFVYNATALVLRNRVSVTLTYSTGVRALPGKTDPYTEGYCLRSYSPAARIHKQSGFWQHEGDI